MWIWFGCCRCCRIIYCRDIAAAAAAAVTYEMKQMCFVRPMNDLSNPYHFMCVYTNYVCMCVLYISRASNHFDIVKTNFI